jgi:PAS domain S-box-containing protein
MKHKKPIRDQLMIELAEARQLIDELMKSASDHKKIEEAIKGSEEHYRNLVENAHDVAWVFDLNLGYTYISPSVKHLRGYSVEEAMKQRLDQVLTPESAKKARELFERERDLEMSGYRHGPDWSHTAEFEMIHKDGSTFWVEITMNPLHDEAGRIKGIMGITRDISERNRAEEALRKSEAKYRFLTEKMNDIIGMTDLNLKIIYVSPSIEKFSGFTPEECIQLDPTEMMTPESIAKAVDVLSAELKLEQDEGIHPERTATLELEYYHKNGSTVWMESVASFIRDDTGKIIGIHGVSRDITDRRRAESVMKESEEHFRSLIQKSSDIIVIMDANGVIIYETPSLESILGYQPGYLIGKSPFDLIHPDDLERVVNDLNQVYLKTNPGIPTEFRCRKPDGNWVYLEAIGQNLLEDPAINGIVITARDITDRKLEEEALKESEQRFSAIFENAADGILLADIETNKFYMGNKQICEALGFSADEIKNLTVMDIHPAHDLPYVLDQFKNLASQKIKVAKDVPVKRKDGNVYYADVSAFPIPLMERTYLLGIFRDITDRKQAEEELKKHRDHLEDLVKERTSKLVKANEQLEKQIEERRRAEDALRMNEEIFRIHFSLSNDVMFTSDNEFRVLSVTPNVERVLGYKPQELVGRTFQEIDVLHPDDLGNAADNAKHVLSGGASRHPTFRFITKDGKTKFGEVSGVPLIKKGHGTALISVARDVTERIEKEQVLMETLERYRTHFTLTDDVMFSFDHKLRIKSVSPNVERVFGYKPEDVIGKPGHKIGALPPEYVDEALDEALHLLSGQTIHSSIYEFITKEGKRKFGEVSSSFLKRDGQVVEGISVIRDITERIKKGKSLQESEATAQALVNACTDFMALIDITGTIIYINKAASENLGRSVKELLGTCLFDDLPKEVADRRKIYFEQVISSGKPIGFEDENRGRLIHSSWFPIFNELGKVTRIAIHTRDITELKQAFFKSKT